MTTASDIAVTTLVLSVLGSAISITIYIWARPRLALEVAHAEVVSVRMSSVLSGGPLSVAMTNLDIVVRNIGHRTARIDDWTVVRHLGTEREHQWGVAPRDGLPRRFGIRARGTRRWAAALHSQHVVNVSAQEAWSDVDLLVTYRPFFFWRPQTISKHFALAPREGLGVLHLS
jgi:hypothetical protein